MLILFQDMMSILYYISILYNYFYIQYLKIPKKNEFIADSDKRIKFISGFTGTNGFCLIS